MDASEFRKRGREMVDYIADYMTQIRSRSVTPEVEPGYLRKLLPSTAPKKGEEWESIMVDLERAVMPGITHWQHPHFHAYFPAGNSYPSILGDMLSDAISCIGFSWAASPACVELETLVLDWVGKMIELPKQFLHSSGQGGGAIQGSASECVLVALLSARHHTIRLLKQRQPYIEECQILSKLVGYCSKLAHSCVEKAGMIGFVKMRHLDVDESFALRGHVLEDAIEEDKKLGLIPFFVCATLGTTACCSFDNLGELGEVAKRQGVYLHVDAAYAGNALICPEFQHLKDGVENVDSFGFNTNKWLQVNFDCSLMWVKNVDTLTTALTVDPLYLQHKHGDKAIDLRHWGIPLSRRFRALKLWFVIRTYGVEGLQKRIREHCRLAKMFATKVLADDRFEILGEVTMGLVCFRLLGPNSLTQKLLKTINEGGKLHMVPAMLNEHYIIRFALCTEHACDDDVNYAWKVITSAATDLLQGRQRCDSNKEHTSYDLNSVSDEDTFAAFEEEIIFDNQREHLQRAQVMRSLFFKMVSDPKCYNPRVLKSLSRQVTTQRKNTNSSSREEHADFGDFAGGVKKSINFGGKENEITEKTDLTMDQPREHKKKIYKKEWEKMTSKNKTQLGTNSFEMGGHGMMATGRDNIKVGETSHPLSKQNPQGDPHEDPHKPCQTTDEQNDEYDDDDNDEDDYNGDSDEEWLEKIKDIFLRKENLADERLELKIETKMAVGSL